MLILKFNLPMRGRRSLIKRAEWSLLFSVSSEYPTVHRPSLAQADSAEKRRVVLLVVFEVRTIITQSSLLRWTLFKSKMNGDQAGVL